jgi:hypothetical protein
LVLDPFAGSGVTLFTAAEMGLSAMGIELLPSSAEIVDVRKLLLSVDRPALARSMTEFAKHRRWETDGPRRPLPSLRITRGAYPSGNALGLERYLYEIAQLADERLARVLRFAALCVLESISYTRKDGQYLRWDVRSGRGVGRRGFDKGLIPTFSEAVAAKIREIATDITATGAFVNQKPIRGAAIRLHQGSALDLLPQFDDQSFAGLVTSPPYCNRYDYTRSYALELALLGVHEDEIRRLRQSMLCCTVENREKTGLDRQFSRATYRQAVEAFASQHLLQRVLRYLENCRANRTLNNAGIPRMVRNYFFEMALIIADSARILQPHAPLVMVNDNVRYQGAHVPVDLILSDFAEKCGFEVPAIWVLPRGKGNSSQQMGQFGRTELRKCVYVWRVKKP